MAGLNLLKALRKAPGRLERLPGAPAHVEGPVPRVVQAAEDLARERGINLTRQSEYGVASPRRGKYIADEYDRMKHAPDDPKVKAAYSAMAADTMAQWQALQKAGIDIDFMPAGMPDPYPKGPREALADLRANNHLWVFPTEQGYGSDDSFQSIKSPLLEPTGITHKGHPMLVNDAFRAVHDVFGHGMEGANFGARGEENAWNAHQRLFSPEALPAVTSETRGQNSWVNFGPYGEANRANQKNTHYADQKVGIMPDWTSRPGGMPMKYRVQQGATAGAVGAGALLAGSSPRTDAERAAEAAGESYDPAAPDPAPKPQNVPVEPRGELKASASPGVRRWLDPAVDAARAVPSAAANVVEGIPGMLGDMSDLKWTLANLIADYGKSKGSSLDQTGNVAQAQALTQTGAPTTEQVQAFDDQFLPPALQGALRYQPQTGPGVAAGLATELMFDPTSALPGAKALKAMRRAF